MWYWDIQIYLSKFQEGVVEGMCGEIHGWLEPVGEKGTSQPGRGGEGEEAGQKELRSCVWEAQEMGHFGARSLFMGNGGGGGGGGVYKIGGGHKRYSSAKGGGGGHFRFSGSFDEGHLLANHVEGEGCKKYPPLKVWVGGGEY